MPGIQNANPLTPKHITSDTTPPPKPVIVISRAYIEVDDMAPVGSDPVYIELENFEVGARIQLINLSDNPAASFDVPGDVVELPITGHDLFSRTASVELDEAQMKKLGLQPGDRFRIRAVKPSAGENDALSASESTLGNVAARWEGSGRHVSIPDPRGRPNVTISSDTATVDVLRGGQRHRLTMAEVVDTRAPVLLTDRVSARPIWVSAEGMPVVDGLAHLPSSFFEESNFSAEWWATPTKLREFAVDESLPQAARDAFAALAKDGILRHRLLRIVADPALSKIGEKAVHCVLKALAKGESPAIFSATGGAETGAKVVIQNQRTGVDVQMTVDDERAIVGAIYDVRAGDPLVFQATDSAGLKSAPTVVIYDPNKRSGLRSGSNLIHFRLQQT